MLACLLKEPKDYNSIYLSFVSMHVHAYVCEGACTGGHIVGICLCMHLEASYHTQVPFFQGTTILHFETGSLIDVELPHRANPDHQQAFRILLGTALSVW